MELQQLEDGIDFDEEAKITPREVTEMKLKFRQKMKEIGPQEDLQKVWHQAEKDFNEFVDTLKYKQKVVYPKHVDLIFSDYCDYYFSDAKRRGKNSSVLSPEELSKAFTKQAESELPNND